MRLLLDASVLVPLLHAEDRSLAVRDYIRSVGVEAIISDFAVGETITAFGALMRRQILTPQAASEAVANLDVLVARRTRAITEPDDVKTATAMVRRFDLALRMPDALYVALAKRRDLTLMTADVTLAKAAQAFGVDVAGPEF